MRKIIVTEFITLDGVVEAPGGNETPHLHAGWQFKFSSPETGKYKVDELAGVYALLLGKNTYELFAGYWPGQTGGGFADRMNQLPKYVVSRSLQKVEWNNSHILRDVAKDVAALKKTDGGDILVYGSATIVKASVSLRPHRRVATDGISPLDWRRAEVRAQILARNRQRHSYPRISAGQLRSILCYSGWPPNATAP